LARVPEIEATVSFRGTDSSSRLNVAGRKKLRTFAAALNLDAAAGRGFDCVITNDAEMQSLNRTFLRHDYPTDVLSFPSGSKHGIVGELAISADRAAAQAAEFGHSLIEELQILILHGLLHLLGHDHESDRGRMQKEEERLRSQYGLPNALIGRTAAPAPRKASSPPLKRKASRERTR
jgi:probable rRNA maturation factor